MKRRTGSMRHMYTGAIAACAASIVAGADASGADALPAWQVLLERIVNVNSGTNNPDGLEAVRRTLIPEFEKLGFEATTYDLEDGHKVVSFVVPEADPELLLMGHIDTVFKNDSKSRVFEVRGEKIYGPGIIDMKAGLVLMLELAKELRSSDRLKRLMIVLNDDEEIGSPYSKPLVQKLVTGVKSGLIFEPGLPDGAVVTSQSGVHWLKLSVAGKPSHAGLEPESGINACVELGDKAVRLSRLTDFTRRLTVNVGVIKGGSKPNIVCDSAEATIDIRFVEQDDLQRALDQIQSIADEMHVFNERLGQAPTAEVETIVSVSSMPESYTERLYRLLQTAGKTVNQQVTGRHVGYVSDGNQLAETGMDLLVGLGPYGDGMHTDGEYLTISTYAERLALARALIEEILK